MSLEKNRNAQKDPQSNDQQTQEERVVVEISGTLSTRLNFLLLNNYSYLDPCSDQSSNLANERRMYSEPQVDPIYVDSDDFDELSTLEFERALAQEFFCINQSLDNAPSRTDQVTTQNTFIPAIHNIGDLPEIADQGPSGNTHTSATHNIDVSDLPDISSSRIDTLDLTDNPATPRTPSVISVASSESIVSLSTSLSTSTAASLVGPSAAPVKSKVLRKRSNLQLNPFTVENARYQQLVSRLPPKSKLSNTQVIPTDDDDSDADFMLTDTQGVDENVDEILTQELSSLKIRKPKQNVHLPEILSPSTASPVVENNDLELESVRQKYGLDRLILPPSRNIKDNTKKKPITFQIRKKGSKRKQGITRPISSRVIETPAKDIFDFDLYALASTKSSIVSPIVIDDSTTSDSSVSRFDIDKDGMDEDELRNDDSDDGGDEIPFFKRPRLNKRSILLSDSEDENNDDDQEEETKTPEILTQEQLDDIFNFPTTSRRHLRNAADQDDIVPIVNDEAEHRETKRVRMGIKDLKAHGLKNVLPASYYKINELKFGEEIRQHRLAKQARNTTTNPSAAIYRQSRKQRNTQDIFAAFRSQSDDSDDSDDYDNYIDDHEDHDNGGSFFNPSSRKINKGKEKESVPQTWYAFSNTAPATSRSLNPSNTVPSSSRALDSLNTASKTSTFSSSRSIAFTTDAPALSDTQYSLEAMEDNRVSRQRMRITDSRNRAPNNTPRSTTTSSTSISRLSNTTKRPHHVKNNAMPLRRRKPKRTRDDMYVLAPHYMSNTNQGHHKRNNNETIYANNTSSISNENVRQRAVDDICMYTKPSNIWRKSGLIHIGNYDISDYIQNYRFPKELKRQLGVKVYTLHTIVKKVRGLMDVDLRRISSLKETSYLHHRLLYPLLSSTPNKKSAYIHFEKTHSDLVLFGKKLFWKDIIPKNTGLLNDLFARVFQDMIHMRYDDKYNNQSDFSDDLHDHDYFYVFVSLCLAQWIPILSHEDQIRLTKQFAVRVRSLACTVSELADLTEAQRNVNMPWKAIVKLMLFILDWTCRLHHLGIDNSDWSVTNCTQIIMDILVFIGYDSIKARKEDYLIEAWICVFQIMSVSTGRNGYHFNEQVFLNQMTSSIKRKSKPSEKHEVEKRRTTAQWSEVLENIIVDYMM